VVRLLRLHNNFSDKEWNGKYSRNCPYWSEAERNGYYKGLGPGEFYMEFGDYLEHFAHTCLNLDAQHREHYQISSAGISMRDKKDYFFQFRLEREINCYEDTLAIMCEQQGNRIVTAYLPDFTKRKFYPSNFAIMLMYRGDGSEDYELMQSDFDAQFKLTLTVDSKILPIGNYIIMVAPEWNQSTHLDP